MEGSTAHRAMQISSRAQPHPWPQRAVAGAAVQALELPAARVAVILTELEEHKGFLFRNAEGAVNWAYPVTAEKTPHLLKLNTGEQVYAA